MEFYNESSNDGDLLNKLPKKVSLKDDGDDEFLMDQSPLPGVASKPPALHTSDAATIDSGLYHRLCKVKVLSQSDQNKITEEMVELGPEQTVKYLNGELFAHYLTVLNDLMKKQNQDLNIGPELL